MTSKAAIDRYHRFVATQACMNCHIEGFSQVSHYTGLHGHLFGRGGKIKAHFMCVTSLCCDRPGVKGCHAKFDNNELSTHPTSGRFEKKIDYSERHLAWEMQTIIKAVKEGVITLE